MSVRITVSVGLGLRLAVNMALYTWVVSLVYTEDFSVAELGDGAVPVAVRNDRLWLNLQTVLDSSGSL